MDPGPERLLDAALPRRDITECHARMVLALPESVWHALRDVSMRDLPVVAPTSLRVDVQSVAALRPVDVLIRRELLRAVARRAEATGG